MLISHSESYWIGDSNCLCFFLGTLHLCSFLNIEQHEIKDFNRCHPAPEAAPTSCVASGGPGQVKSLSLLGSYQLISRISFQKFFIMLSFTNKSSLLTMMVSNSLQINFLGKNTDQLYIYRDATAYSRSPILESSTRAVHLSTGNIAVQLIFALSVAIIIVTIQARNAECRKYINVRTLVGLLLSSGFMGILFLHFLKVF